MLNGLEGCARWHPLARHLVFLMGRPLGYEAVSRGLSRCPQARFGSSS
jgi:hypothetical protein